MTIKAIETVYNGYRFRSRLEARWAVFFDELGIEYEYEPEGFDLGEFGYYLPDFWLPEMTTWVEIKGALPTDIERKKCYKMSSNAKQLVFLLWGQIGISDRIPDFGCISPYSTCNLEIFAGECWSMWKTPYWDDEYWNMGFGLDSDSGLANYLKQYGGFSDAPQPNTEENRKRLVEMDREHFFNKYGKVHERWEYGRHERESELLNFTNSGDGKIKAQWGWIIPLNIANAMNAARQARFEHGQIGSPRNW